MFPIRHLVDLYVGYFFRCLYIYIYIYIYYIWYLYYLHFIFYIILFPLYIWYWCYLHFYIWYLYYLPFFIWYMYIYITNLVCYPYFHWLFNPECQHILGKQTGYICTFSVSLIWAPKKNNNVGDKNRNIYASLNQYHNTE